jgi:hypothetical protein
MGTDALRFVLAGCWVVVGVAALIRLHRRGPVTGVVIAAASLFLAGAVIFLRR